MSLWIMKDGAMVPAATTKGFKGDKGDKGDAGPVGPRGADGSSPSGGNPSAVSFRVARQLSYPDTQVLSGTWPTVDFANVPVASNTGGGVWDPATNLYTVPTTGTYLLTGNIRIGDDAPVRNVGVGIHTGDGDGSHIVWRNMGNPNTRDTFQYQRVVKLDAGAQVRFYIYAGGNPFPMSAAAFTADLLDAGPPRGNGSPEGVVTAPVGTEYTDNQATNGAVKWVKASGTGNIGWRVTYGDTGWRRIDSGALAQGHMTWRRIGSEVILGFAGGNFDTVEISASSLADGPAPGVKKSTLIDGYPPGFGLVGVTTGPITRDGYEANGNVFVGANVVQFRGLTPDTLTLLRAPLTTWVTTDPWPTSLPGSPL